MTLLLNREDVKSLLSMEDAVDAVEAAFRELALGNVTMPQRTAIHIPSYEGLHLGMPAYIAGDGGGLGLKVVTIYPRNPTEYNLPTTIGVTLLTDPRTGAPLAVMDAGYLTAMRTGAAGESLQTLSTEGCQDGWSFRSRCPGCNTALGSLHRSFD